MGCKSYPCYMRSLQIVSLVSVFSFYLLHSVKHQVFLFNGAEWTKYFSKCCISGSKHWAFLLKSVKASNSSKEQGVLNHVVPCWNVRSRTG